MKADLEAWLTSDAAGRAERFRREGQTSEAEHFTEEVEGHLRKEALDRRNSQEFLDRRRRPISQLTVEKP